MLTKANRRISAESSFDQNEQHPPLAVVTSCSERKNRGQPSGFLKFAWRMIKDRNLYGALAFAETAESLRLNVRALQVGSHDRVVGVTSSGDLLLSLLAAGPEAVVGYDANNAQTVLAHLKIASIRALTVENYLRFMGVNETNPETRIAIFNRISRSMPSFARRDMLGKRKLVEEGILNHGMTHLIIQVMTALFSRVFGRETYGLFIGGCGTDEDRSQALHRILQKRSIRYLLQPLLRAAAPRLKWLFFPHRFCRISSRPDEIITDFFTTFRDLFVKGVQANPVLCRSATGNVHPEWRKHLYNDQTFELIRDNISRLELGTADILSGLHRVSDGWATRVYLSNVPDYLSEEQLSELVRELQRAAAPGARIVYYSLYDQDLLHTLGPQIPAQELQDLQESDNVHIYPMLMVRKRASL